MKVSSARDRIAGFSGLALVGSGGLYILWAWLMGAMPFAWVASALLAVLVLTIWISAIDSSNSGLHTGAGLACIGFMIMALLHIALAVFYDPADAWFNWLAVFAAGAASIASYGLGFSLDFT